MILCVSYTARIISVPTGMYVCICVCMHVCMYVGICVYMHAHMYVCKNLEGDRLLSISAASKHTHVCMYVRMYMNTQDTWG